MAERAVIQLDVDSGDARAEVTQTQDALSDLQVEAVEAGDGFERLSNSASTELAETRAQAERTASSMQQMGGAASSTANNLGFELTQAAQDAQFGMAGVANQIPLISEQFQRLSQQSGGTRGALGALASAFTGPTGILAAGTLAIQFLPQLREAFADTGDSAADTASKIEDIADAASDVIEVTSEQTQDLELSLGQVDGALQTTEERIGSLQGRIEALQRLQGLVSPIQEVRQSERTQVGREQATGEEQRSVDEIIAQTRERFNLENATQEQIEERVQDLQEELSTEEGVQQNLEDQQQSLQEQLRAQQRLTELGAQKADSSEDSADATEREAEAMNALAVSAKQAAENRQALRRFQAAGGSQGQLFGPTNFGRTPTVGGTMLNQGQSQGALMLQAAQDAGLVSQFESAEGVMSDLEQQSEETFNSAQLGARLATQAVGGLTSAISSSQSAMDSLQQSAASILDTISGTFLTQALKGASVAGLSGGPLGLLGIGAGVAGGILQSFEHGGEPAAGPARLHPPEVMMMNGQEQIVGREETEAILRRASGRGAGNGAVVRKLDEVAARIQQMEIRMDPYGVRQELGRIEEEQSEFSISG